MYLSKDYMSFKWYKLFLEHKNLLFVLTSRIASDSNYLTKKELFLSCFGYFWSFFFLGLLCAKISLEEKKHGKNQ